MIRSKLAGLLGTCAFLAVLSVDADARNKTISLAEGDYQILESGRLVVHWPNYGWVTFSGSSYNGFQKRCDNSSGKWGYPLKQTTDWLKQNWGWSGQAYVKFVDCASGLPEGSDGIAPWHGKICLDVPPIIYDETLFDTCAYVSEVTEEWVEDAPVGSN